MSGGTMRERRQRRNLEGGRAAQHENTVFRKQRHSLGAGGDHHFPEERIRIGFDQPPRAPRKSTSTR